MSTLSLRVVCINPPLILTTSSTEFGLQDNDDNLILSTPQADGSLLFSCEVTIKGAPAQGQPDFRGAFIHGTPTQRFLYLTLRPIDASGARARQIVKRLKIGLHTITWEQIAQTQVLQVTVDGRGAARVPLLDGGWRVVEKETAR